METIKYYYDLIKPHLTRRLFEVMAAIFIVVCILSVWLASRPHQATIKLKENQLTYQGQVLNNKLTGKGKLTYKNGDSYEGQFLNGAFNGKGTYKSKAGWVYEGEFKKGQADGKGKLTTESKVVYEGRFKKGVFQDGN